MKEITMKVFFNCFDVLQKLFLKKVEKKRKRNENLEFKNKKNKNVKKNLNFKIHSKILRC